MKEKSQNKMAVMSVNKLLLNMGIPMILSMALQAVYNIVDSAFVSNMEEGGEHALNALTLAFPVQMFMVAIAIGTGVGANAMLSKNLGMGNKERASKVAGNAMFLGIVIYIAFIIFGFAGARYYIGTQTKNTEIFEMGVSYLQICCIMSLGIVAFSIFEKLLQSTGRSVHSTIAQISGAIVNIILDPILIYGLCGFNAYGVKGAAYATVLGQIVSGVVAFVFHLKYNKEIKNGIRYMKPSGEVIKAIYKIGLPAIIAQALVSVMTYILNIIFVRMDEAVVTAYGLFYKIQQFILFIAFGLRDAITPIISFNYGMRSKKRVKSGMKYGMLYTLVVMAIGMCILEIFATQISTLFGLAGKTQQLCIDAMRIVSISFIFAGANTVYQGIFQALDSGIESLIISVCRQFVFIIPVAWGFTQIAIHNSGFTWIIWTTFPIAEFATVLIAIWMMRRISRTKIEIL